MRIFRRETPELDKVREVEGEIREFLRRDNSRLRRCPEPDDSDLIANNINSLLQQVAGTSLQCARASVSSGSCASAAATWNTPEP